MAPLQVYQNMTVFLSKIHYHWLWCTVHQVVQYSFSTFVRCFICCGLYT